MFSSIVMDVESDKMRFANSIDELIEVIETLYKKNKSFKRSWDRFDSFSKIKYVLFSSIKDNPLDNLVLSHTFKIQANYMDIESLIKFANYLGIDEKAEYKSVDGTVTTNLNVLSNILGVWCIWDKLSNQYIRMRENIRDYTNGEYPYYDSLDTDPFYFMN